jgi:hypothetical protein
MWKQNMFRTPVRGQGYVETPARIPLREIRSGRCMKTRHSLAHNGRGAASHQWVLKYLWQSLQHLYVLHPARLSLFKTLIGHSFFSVSHLPLHSLRILTVHFTLSAGHDEIILFKLRRRYSHTFVTGNCSGRPQFIFWRVMWSSQCGRQLLQRCGCARNRCAPTTGNS